MKLKEAEDKRIKGKKKKQDRDMYERKVEDRQQSLVSRDAG